GGGTRLTDIVLVPKQAYVAVRFGDALSASNHVSVLCKLGPPPALKGKKKAPRLELTCRPLPLVDGKPAENTGIQFSDDRDFADLFLVEGNHVDTVRAFLTRELRDALLEVPDAWLRVDGDVLALTLYGYHDPDALDELVGVADALYAEWGATEDSLFGDEGDEREETPATATKEPSHYRSRRKGKKAAAKRTAAAVEQEPASPRLRVLAGAIDVAFYVVGIFFVALTLGTFAWFHPALLFNSPDLHVTEAWQGGWTTKGFGAFVAAETFLVGTFVYQAYLSTHDGQTIGKRLLGAKVVREDGKPLDFLHGVLLRSWIFSVIPLGVAAFLAKRTGFSARTFFEAIPTVPVFGVAALVLGAITVSISMGSGVHDRIARTKVVSTAPFAFEPVQLGVKGLDPVIANRLRYGLGFMAVFVILNVLAAFIDQGKLSFPLY
ncbi:MAG: RDD family protein, partial [Myxococcales bacterium]|nr:RDD family protein [Myxococcales bacterium]